MKVIRREGQRPIHIYDDTPAVLDVDAYLDALDMPQGWYEYTKDLGDGPRRVLRVDHGNGEPDRIWPLVGSTPKRREQVPTSLQKALTYSALQDPTGHRIGVLHRRWAWLSVEQRLDCACKVLSTAITVHDGLDAAQVAEDEADDREAMGCTLRERFVRDALEWVRLDHLPELPTTPHEAWELIRRWYPLYSREAVNPWLYAAVFRASWGADSPRAHIDPAVLMPDGATVLISDEDMGFTVPLVEWKRLGGVDLPAVLTIGIDHAAGPSMSSVLLFEHSREGLRLVHEVTDSTGIPAHILHPDHRSSS